MVSQEPHGPTEGLARIPIGKLLDHLKSSPGDIIPDSQLQGLGFKNTDSSHNILAQIGGIDIVPLDERSEARIGIYRSDPNDSLAYDTLKQFEIPQFRRISTSVDDQATILEIPYGTTSLSGIGFTEQEFTGGKYLGAMEICHNIGIMLGKIFKTTGKIPLGLNLKRLALVKGTEPLIMLVPPIQLVPATNIDEIIKHILSDLNLADYRNKHGIQVEQIRIGFNDIVNP